ncbi:2-Methylisocitrate lyase, PEP mutase family [Tistlia consotensis]|uniref:2-Methylisocitrate lyase, PEP mutase family n=1 Tax=Tistlia consotensis USBA 355 TaxID=560819 RepID=A0A1Y6BUD5_9PROT|nr:isocitrate lyase/phosphoenolpyruvate mutase family protein [Tistlia consotensis]SMF21829.1 2-Methylisocitrate lyase, PEP mutase family [Tistlia consotensis USBA 355]SNR46530.1 2-Methylisocitrate lyase, PEP mutase family [Tistlia consotensis]
MVAADDESRAAAFAALHAGPGIFVLPNPWDIGSAKLLTALGFPALATTSAGYAFSRGKQDKVGETGREEALAHAREIVGATHLPVSADLENGFGDRPEDVAETVRRAAEAGLSGCTIEDTTGDPARPIYERSHAIERIAAGVEAAKSLPRPFQLTARAENYLHGRPDFDDTLARLQGYEAVGAPVLYAPGLPDLAAISRVCEAVSRPVNVVAGIGLQGVTLAELEAAGVRRVSLGSALARTALGAMLSAARGILVRGSFDGLSGAASFAGIKALLSEADSLAGG